MAAMSNRWFPAGSCMSKFRASMRPTSAGIIVFGAPALLQAAEQFASGFWRIFCLIGLLGVLHLARTLLERQRTASAVRKRLRGAREAPKNTSERCAAVGRT